MDNFDSILSNVENKTVFESLVKAKEKVSQYDKISVSISGGADSDVMLDIMSKVDDNKKVRYVWFDTGLEYQATKDHVKYLEEKYDITIDKYKPVKAIPNAVREYGIPFLSKRVSDMVNRLQSYGFKWEDRSFDELVDKYPRCKAALRWWCNNWGDGSQFNIDHNRYLREFMIQNPPTFRISNKCCKFAKKDVKDRYIKDHDIDLNCYGVRKAEGGARATAYKNCFSQHDDKSDEFRPIFWYTDSDRLSYEETFNVTHSKCYSEYGLKRTGCCGCPYGREFENELDVIQKYEPKLYKACINIFGESYEYTRKYKEFVKMMKEKSKEG